MWEYHRNCRMNNIARSALSIFIIAFILNFLWEEAHSVLYISYRGGEITSLILFNAAVYDAVIISLFSLSFLRLSYFTEKRWILPLALTIFAIGLEIWALETNRWVYADTMPIVPLLNVGLTPIIQLGLLGFLSVHLGERLLLKR